MMSIPCLLGFESVTFSLWAPGSHRALHLLSKECKYFTFCILIISLSRASHSNVAVAFKGKLIFQNYVFKIPLVVMLPLVALGLCAEQ